MRTRAPGKLVLSGGYAVLHGAPSLVCAVSAWAVADDRRSPSRSSPELRAAYGDRKPPIVDTSSMRAGGEKLGLGSSAAVVVAAVALDVWRRVPAASREALRPSIADRSRTAHREAQGGGSGIDVLASTYGGFLRVRLAPEGPIVTPTSWPDGLGLAAFFCGRGASTKGLLGQVRALAERDRAEHDEAMAAAIEGAEEVDRGLESSDLEAVLRGLRAQQRALAALGDAAGCDIVPATIREASALAEPWGALVATTGAGGGDTAVVVSRGPVPAAVAADLASRGLQPIPLSFGVPGVEALPSARR